MIQKLRNFRNYFNFSENKGLAQIPLLLGLLLMAIAVPVATQLVKQNQDTRNKAAGTSVCYPSNGTTICYYPTSAPATAVPTATPTAMAGGVYCSASTNAICPGKCIATVNGGTCPSTTSSLPSPSPTGSQLPAICCSAPNDAVGTWMRVATCPSPMGFAQCTSVKPTNIPTPACFCEASSGRYTGTGCGSTVLGQLCRDITAFPISPIATVTKVPTNTLIPTVNLNIYCCNPTTNTCNYFSNICPVNTYPASTPTTIPRQCSQTTYPTTSCVIGNTIYGWSCNGTTGGWECKATTPVATATPYKPFCPGYCSSNGLCNLGDASNNVAYSCGTNSTSTCCIPKTTPTPRQCSQTTYPTTSCVIGNTIYGWSCNTTTLGWECKATTPVATVTPIPCMKDGVCSVSFAGCCSGKSYPVSASVCFSTGTMCGVAPTTPTPKQCSQTTYPTTSCQIANMIYGWTCNTTTLAWECKATTPVATVTPVNLCGGIASVCSGKKIGDSCNIFGTCHAGTAGVISDCNCKLGAVPTNTPTLTPKPTAYTPTIEPCHCGLVGGKYIYTGNCSQTVDGTSCNSPTPVKPTATPSVKLAPSPTVMPGVTGICRYSCTAEGRLPANSSFCTPGCVAPLLCCGAPIPTSALGDACNGIDQKCQNDTAYVCNLARTGFSSQACATGYSCDSSGFRCVPDGSGTSTPSPTRVPTATPTLIKPTATPTSGGICILGLIGNCPVATPTAKPTSGGGSNPTDVPATPTMATRPSITISPSMCTMCPSDFKCYVNNGDYKWFSSYFQGNGYVLATGAEATSCGGVVKPPFLNKTKGDANCDGMVDIDDRSLWTKEYTTDRGAETMSKVWLSDFDCDSKVTIYDRSIWTQNFIQLNSSSAN
ncbi:hypothetical protein KBC75_02230 [Candidatus Shapirobacteria bacterium]|nr:hypothetical protein [Candidatus Shapirobacteria bacterium]